MTSRSVRVWPAGLRDMFVVVSVEEDQCPGCVFAAKLVTRGAPKAARVFGFQETADGTIVYRALTFAPGSWSCREIDPDEGARVEAEEECGVNCKPSSAVS